MRHRYDGSIGLPRVGGMWRLVGAVLGLALAFAAGILAAVGICPGCAPAVARTSVHARPTPDRGLELGGLSDAQCLSLMDKRDRAATVGKVVAFLGGSAGIAAAIPVLAGDTGTTRSDVVTGIGAGLGVVAGSVGAAAAFVTERRSDEFERYCEVRDKGGAAPGDDGSPAGAALAPDGVDATAAAVLPNLARAVDGGTP